MNLKALKLIFPDINLSGVEINKKAAKELESIVGGNNVYNESIFDFNTSNSVELSLIKRGIDSY